MAVDSGKGSKGCGGTGCGGRRREVPPDTGFTWPGDQLLVRKKSRTWSLCTMVVGYACLFLAPASWHAC